MNPSTCRRSSAFTLLEIVIAVAILAILAGAAVPLTSRFFNSRARASTRTELADIGVAAAEYFRDTGQLPAAVQSLLVDPGVAGWSGPYVMMSSEEPWSGSTDVLVDAWAHAYRLDTSGASVLVLTSAAEGGSLADGNDIELRVDVTPIRREKTLTQLATINQAITRYNALYLPDNPLSTSYPSLLTRLVSTGFLPAGEAYSDDGWGDAFVPDPLGKSPVVAVTSPNLGSSSGGSGASGGGKGGKSGKGKPGKASPGDRDAGQGNDSKSGSGSTNGKPDGKDKPSKKGKGKG